MIQFRVPADAGYEFLRIFFHQCGLLISEPPISQAEERRKPFLLITIRLW